MIRYFVPPEETTPERRALFVLVEREVEALLTWEGAAELPPQVAAVAVLAIHELGVMDGGPLPHWASLRYDLLLDRFVRVSLVHPLAVRCYLDAWVAWAQWLHVQGRIDDGTLDRLLDEVARGADRFIVDASNRFALLAPVLLGDDDTGGGRRDTRRRPA